MYIQGYSLCGTVYQKKSKKIAACSETVSNKHVTEIKNQKSHGTTHKHHNEIINVVHLTIVTFYDILHLGFRIEKAKS